MVNLVQPLEYESGLFAGYPFTTGTQKAAKLSNKNSSFNWVHSILTESRNASHSTNYSQIHATIFPSSSLLPRKPATAHNSSIRSDEGLTLEASAF